MTLIKERICEAAINYDINDKDKEVTYHNTALLLKLYRKVLWRLENAIYDMDQEVMEQTSKNLLSFVDTLVEIDPRVKQKRIEARLRSIEESKSIINFIDQALLRVKDYPDHGEAYYDILYLTYIHKEKMPLYDVIEALHISRTTYYREKKKAIELLGVILWGYILPELTE